MNLRLKYSDIYTEVSEYLGTGDIPVDRDLRKAQEIVLKGYRRFLKPMNPFNNKRHYWSFLDKTATLTLESNKWVYQLPADLDKIKTKFHFAADSGYVHMMCVNRDMILEKRSVSVDCSYPTYYAIVPVYNKSVGELNEMWVYSTPNSNYVLNYSYYFIPPQPENDDDYLAGGDIYDEVILACCLAEAELKHTKKMGPMQVHAEKLLAEAVLSDQKTKPSSVGMNLDPGIHRTKISRPLPAIQQSELYDNE